MNFFHTHISEKSIELAIQTLSSGFVSEGKRVAEFEVALTQTLGLVQPVALNSGTSALHLALAVAGVGPGDEVILPAQTFVASAMSVLMCSAKPVFDDIQPNTGNLDHASVHAQISSKTKAIMPVHWGGYPCDMDEINDIARQHGLAVVEDAAHALGATYKGRPVGAISRFTAFSFQAIKHLTTGDGGALCCLEEADYHCARRRRWFGIDRERDLPSSLGERAYDLNELGFKYHMNDLAASVGLGNLADVPSHLARHRQIEAMYRKELDGIPGVGLLESRQDRQSAHWFFTILVKRREEFVSELKRRGCPATVVHQRIDRNRLFGGLRDDLPGQRHFDEHQIALPLHVGMSDDDVQSVLDAVYASR